MVCGEICIFLKKLNEKKRKITTMPWILIDVKMLNFLGGGANFIPGATSIPDSRVIFYNCFFSCILQEFKFWGGCFKFL